MAGTNRISLLNRALPLALTAAPDSQDDLATQGAKTIMDIGREVERRRVAETAAKAIGSPVTSVTRLTVGAASKGAAEAASDTGLRAMALRGLKAGVSAGSKAGSRLIPGVGEAMLAYEVFEFGYRATTGRDFDTTTVGKMIRRGEDGLWHAGLGSMAAAADAVGLPGVGSFARGWVSEAATGTRMNAPAPAIKTPEQQGADSSMRPAPTMPLRAGPHAKLTFSDWDETPYHPTGASVTMPTTPLRRAFATMDMLVQDIGLETPSPARQASRAAAGRTLEASSQGLG